MTTTVDPTRTAPLSEYLRDLERVATGLGKTSPPDLPEDRADVYRQVMMRLSYGYFACFHADAAHPDWSPLWNPVSALPPNPDDICLQTPISASFSYRLSGHRGTVKMITFNTLQSNAVCSGRVEHTRQVEQDCDLDDRQLHIGPDGKFEMLMSAERPAQYRGNWLRIKPGADMLIVRKRSYDWAGEIDPVLSIECLDRVPFKSRLTPDQILARIGEMAAMPSRCSEPFDWMQDALRDGIGCNVFQPTPISGTLSRQIALPAVYDYAPDEALILETELPRVRPYWSFQINDPYDNAVEHVYRLSSTNGHFAKASSDGKFRAVLSLEDPGVPNWLDTAGFTRGTIYGRWYDCDSCPTPTLKRVKLTQLRDHLPADTPVATPEQRAEELRTRVRGYQRRRRW